MATSAATVEPGVLATPEAGALLVIWERPGSCFLGAGPNPDQISLGIAGCARLFLGQKPAA